MKKFLKLIFALILAGVSTPALASTYKCMAESVNNDVVRYEVELSFDPMSFRVDSFFKEDDGSWSLTSKMFADSTAVLTPVKILWSDFQTELNSSASKISFVWSRGAEASGLMVLDLNLGSGEFYSSIEMGGTVYRLVRFSECVVNESQTP